MSATRIPSIASSAFSVPNQVNAKLEDLLEATKHYNEYKRPQDHNGGINSCTKPADCHGDQVDSHAHQNATTQAHSASCPAYQAHESVVPTQVLYSSPRNDGGTMDATT